MENGEKVYSKNFPAFFKMNFEAASVNMVMGGKAKIEVFVDGKFLKEFSVNKNDLYNLADFQGEYGEHEIELRFSGEYIELFALTFG
jgi:hypothetical protein